MVLIWKYKTGLDRSKAWLHGRFSQISFVFHPSPSPRMGLAEFIESVEAVSVAHILGFIECSMEWSSHVVQRVCGILPGDVFVRADRLKQRPAQAFRY